MLDTSLDSLRCAKCNSKLDAEILLEKHEIIEGILYCKNCQEQYPVIEKVAIVWDGFDNYLSSRPSLGGTLYHDSKTTMMRNYVKESLSKIKKTSLDRSTIEKKWTKIYQENSSSRFYSSVFHKIKKFTLGSVLEYGCSIGTMAQKLARDSKQVFGIDRSYHAIKIAKNHHKENLDFFVADSMSQIFGKTKFDTVLALNLLELVEPIPFLENVANQISSGYLVLTDPYDYDRGGISVKHPLYSKELRDQIQSLDFKILSSTKNPSHISWNLKLNERAVLNYKVDLIIAKK